MNAGHYFTDRKIPTQLVSLSAKSGELITIFSQRLLDLKHPVFSPRVTGSGDTTIWCTVEFEPIDIEWP